MKQRGQRLPPALTPVVAIDRRAAVPLYRQLYAGYRDAIVAGRLRAGQRLPSTRALALELGISRIPVVAAFEQLLAEGYFESRVGAGTFVATSLAAEPEPPREGARVPGPRPASRLAEVALARVRPEPWLRGWGAFRVSQPALDQFPFAVWSRLVTRHCRNPRARLLTYGDPMGDRAFREAIAAYLRTARSVRCDAEQVLIISGSQQALELTARVLLDRRSPVWVEEPGYGGARDVLALAGARLIPVPVDDEGLDVAAGTARSPRARAAYVTPSHQYPLGVTMSASRRLQLLDWAERAGAWIIEDDYDSEYRYDSQPIASLQGLDRDARVIYIGTFSKVLLPALRVGYLVVPADLVDRFRAVREAMDLFPPTLHQAALTDFISEGHFARHLRRMRQLYRERRRLLRAALEEELGATVLGSAAGMHLAATLPGLGSDRRLAEAAARDGVWAMPLSACYLEQPMHEGLVLGYGGTGARQIRDGVRRLGELMGRARGRKQP